MKRILSLLLLCAATAAVSCGNDNDGSESAPGVSVTGVELNQTALSMVRGMTKTLTATTTPADATNAEIVWSSGDTDFATVSTSGEVTAVGESGKVTITATSVDGGKTAVCEVTLRRLDFEREAVLDKLLPADPYASDANSYLFDVYSLDMDYHAVIVDYGAGDWLRNTPCQWAGVYEAEDAADLSAATSFQTKKWELVGQGMPNSGGMRYGLLFIIPSSVEIGDLFGTAPLLDESGQPRYDAWGEPVYKLKPEWEGEGVKFGQEVKAE